MGSRNDFREGLSALRNKMPIMGREAEKIGDLKGDLNSFSKAEEMSRALRNYDIKNPTASNENKEYAAKAALAIESGLSTKPNPEITEPERPDHRRHSTKNMVQGAAIGIVAILCLALGAWPLAIILGAIAIPTLSYGAYKKTSNLGKDVKYKMALDGYEESIKNDKEMKGLEAVKLGEKVFDNLGLSYTGRITDPETGRQTAEATPSKKEYKDHAKTLIKTLNEKQSLKLNNQHFKEKDAIEEAAEIYKEIGLTKSEINLFHANLKKSPTTPDQNINNTSFLKERIITLAFDANLGKRVDDKLDAFNANRNIAKYTPEQKKQRNAEDFARITEKYKNNQDKYLESAYKIVVGNLGLSSDQEYKLSKYIQGNDFQGNGRNPVNHLSKEKNQPLRTNYEIVLQAAFMADLGDEVNSKCLIMLADKRNGFKWDATNIVDLKEAKREHKLRSNVARGEGGIFL